MISRRNFHSLILLLQAAILMVSSASFGQAPAPKKTPSASGGSKAMPVPAAKATPSATAAAKKATKAPAAPPVVSKVTKAPVAAAPKTTGLPRVYAPTRPRSEAAPKYPWREKIAVTVFWVGEPPAQNNPTPNHKSSWDPEWQINYGGFDDPNPDNRNWEFCPKNFVPKQNPFYVALPFNDVTNREIAKKVIPWHGKKWTGASSDSVCQGIWLAVRYGSKICYAQWEDCGPFNTSDHAYVFGSARPKNMENGGAGLDISPAIRDYLSVSSGALCDWRFVTEEEVPDGPWKRYGKNNPFVKDEAKDLQKLRDEYQELVKKRDAWLQKADAHLNKPSTGIR